jgi:hypothetical protein
MGFGTYLTIGLLTLVGAISFVLKRSGGYAPGWQLRCTTCGHTGDAAKAGLIRIGSTESQTLGYCSKCSRLRWLAIERTRLANSRFKQHCYPMKHLKLRIAWSVGWGIVCLLMIVLWVRSYWWNDFGSRRIASQDFLVQMRLGELGIWCEPASVAPSPPQLKIGEERVTSSKRTYWVLAEKGIVPAHRYFVFHYRSTVQGTAIWIPFWTMAAPLAIAALLPWLPRRFSLRTLLIASTVIAALLGIAVMMLRGS